MPLLAPRQVRGRLKDAAVDCGGGELIEENEGMREKRGVSDVSEWRCTSIRLDASEISWFQKL
ncbi:Uncharacterized protein DAT39_020198 [Clarias magur]|uniref:Uncharacterized protein n=1 Tax=Clarias magur TaxID=1594786 RepID=A0A8J4TZD8_CLAMG|nr:Uncharacterized protein DAT39_020198 [Clarias magur]